MKTRYRSLLGAATLVVLLPLGSAIVNAAIVTAPETDRAAFTTPIDRTIDLAVAQLVATKKLTAAEALVAKEQMQIQFKSLSAAAQQRIVAQAQDTTNDAGAASIAAALQAATTDEIRQALAQVQATPEARTSQRAPMARLGGDGDLVFVATAGPCRVWDSRFGMGPLGAYAAQQVYGYSYFAGYPWSSGDSQGGTGTAGSGNCAGTVYPATPPVSVVATVVVVNTTSTGALRAWNGGTTLTVGGILGWNAGDVLSNTTVIPMNRSIAAYPGSGVKRDFGLYNNSPNAIHTIVDVVGYFIENQATPLDCTYVNGTATSIPASSSIFVSTPACPAGYTAVSAQTSLGNGLYTSTLSINGCRLGNLTGVASPGWCDVLCCRVPGR